MEENIGKVRFTVALPMELVIKMDTHRSQNGITRIEWIKRAITEKLSIFDKENNAANKIEEIFNDVKDIKRIIQKDPKPIS